MRRPTVRTLKTLICALLVSCLGGCGAVKVAYDHGETVVMFWVGRYIDLEPAQESLVRQRVADFFAWHRSTQLEDYVGLASALQDEAERAVTLDDVNKLEDALRERGYRALNRALPDLADIALSLKPEQLAKTAEKFKDNDREYRDDFVDRSTFKRRHDRFEKWLDRVEYWYGSLTAEQKANLQKLTDAQPDDPNLWLAEREAREQELLALLSHIARDKPPRDEVITDLAAFARRMETSPDPKRRTYYEALRASGREIWVAVSAMATPAQRHHAAKELGGWIEDMKAAEPGACAPNCAKVARLDPAHQQQDNHDDQNQAEAAAWAIAPSAAVRPARHGTHQQQNYNN
jgi:hypothetical protein